MNYSTIRSFNMLSSFEYFAGLKNRVEKEITGKSKDYILRVDEEEFTTYLIENYKLEPLVIDYTSEYVEQPKVRTKQVEDPHFRERYDLEVYDCKVTYQFTGTPILFQIQPSSYTMTAADIIVNDFESTVSIVFTLSKKDPEEFKKMKGDCLTRAFRNLDNCNAMVNSWNNGLPSLILTVFRPLKSKYLQENDFFAAINVKVDESTTSVFSTPTIRKKIIPQPSLLKSKDFSSAPMMADEMYNDILKVIYDLGKNMEKKPSTYLGKDEESIRDQFLLILETRYDSTTATGETFNKGGKTDIILKYANDGTNLFVAECKFWHGGSELLKALSQLFDRYLTWRDSKVALILFVENKEFSSVLQTIQKDVAMHPYYSKKTGNRGETSFTYLFHLPGDADKPVHLEIIAFHFNQK